MTGGRTTTAPAAPSPAPEPSACPDPAPEPTDLREKPEPADLRENPSPPTCAKTRAGARCGAAGTARSHGRLITTSPPSRPCAGSRVTVPASSSVWSTRVASAARYTVSVSANVRSSVTVAAPCDSR